MIAVPCRTLQVGLDSVAVTEVQRVVWHGGGAFTVSSETNITNMMGVWQRGGGVGQGVTNEFCRI